MRIFSGANGNKFTSEVDFGKWIVANPTSTSTSLATVQYDGKDNSFALNITGLNINLSSQSYFSLKIQSNGQSQVSISLFDTTGGSCNGIMPIITSSSNQQVVLDIDQFSGNCDINKIGAIEASIYSFTNINSTMENFNIEVASMSSKTPSPRPSSSSSPTQSDRKTLIIDDFTVAQQTILTLEDNLYDLDPNQITSSVAEGSTSSIIGGERDMEMRVYTGLEDKTFYSQVTPIDGGYFQGRWTYSNPRTCSSLATNQYDGADGTFSLDISGLNDIDISGATQLSFYAICDIDTALTLTFYDSMGGTVIGIPALYYISYNNDDYKHVFNLNELDGYCKKEHIGAIEISIESNDAVNVNISHQN